MGPEAEFFIFDNVQFDSKSNGTFYSVDRGSHLEHAAATRCPTLGYKIRHKEGYFPVPPADSSRTSAPRCAW
jgi:glutamine synthetase